jgi:hypothetical protein
VAVSSSPASPASLQHENVNGTGSAEQVVLYCSNPDRRGRLTSILSERYRLVPSQTWRDFEVKAVRASAVVIEVEDLGDQRRFQRLQAFRLCQPSLPMVLITSSRPANAKLLMNFTPDELVWLDEVQTALIPAVHQAGSKQLLSRVCELMEGREELPPLVRHAITLACSASPPLHSVKELAALVHCDRTTLNRQWNRLGTGGDIPSLKAFLDWIMVLKAVSAKLPGRSWRRVASLLDLQVETLAQIAMRRLDLPLYRLDSARFPSLLDRFMYEIVRPLLLESTGQTPLASISI